MATKNEAQEEVVLGMRISKKQFKLLGIIMSILVLAGIVLFFLKHS